MHWRKSTWVFIIWTGLMALWLLSAASQADCKNATYQNACNAGVGIAATFVLFIWFLGAVPMSIIWYGSRSKPRLCPVCGSEVKAGLLQCSRCGYSFAAAVGMPASQVPQCWQCKSPIAMGQTPCPRCGAAIGWGR